MDRLIQTVGFVCSYDLLYTQGETLIVKEQFLIKGPHFDCYHHMSAFNHTAPVCLVCKTATVKSF